MSNKNKLLLSYLQLVLNDALELKDEVSLKGCIRYPNISFLFLFNSFLKIKKATAKMLLQNKLNKQRCFI